MPFLTACGIKEPHTSFTKSERLPWESINCVFCWSNFRKLSNWFTSFKRVSEFRCISSSSSFTPFSRLEDNNFSKGMIINDKGVRKS